MYLECAADKAWFPRPAESHAGREPAWQNTDQARQPYV